MADRYRLCWRSLTLASAGQGEPQAGEVQEFCDLRDLLNKQHPELQHWIEPVMAAAA